MHVVTLHAPDVERITTELCRSVVASWGHPDLVIAVLSGGRDVGEAARKTFVSSPLITVSLSRPGGVFKRRIRTALRRLPNGLTAMMRRIEDRVLRFGVQRRDRPGDVDRLTDALASDVGGLRAGAHKILVVDDAVDSGYTIACVRDAVRRLRADAEVRALVIVQTRQQPEWRPEFCHYRGGVSIRFPWSSDYREPAEK